LADYATRSVFEGPAEQSSALIDALRSEGYEAGVPIELDEVRFHDRKIDPGTGAVTPPLSTVSIPTGVHGLYFLVLKSFPVASWLDDLAKRGILLLEPLPPAAYVAQGERITIEALSATTNYVRGAFPVAPETKKVLFGTERSPSPFTSVSIQAVESKPEGSIRPYLDSVSEKPVSEQRDGSRVTYEASISDLDIDVLTNFESVYSIAPLLEMVPSSERQALLVLKPAVGPQGQLTLPSSCENYGAILASPPYNITNFDNTKIGILDSGFDSGTLTFPAGNPPHPDFDDPLSTNPTMLKLLPNGAFGSDVSDKYTHGTVVTSVISGWVPFASRARDSQNYRYSHGLAPTAKTVMYKIYECGFGNTLTDGLNSLQPEGVNVINYSINALGPSGCAYSLDSQRIDQRSRQDSWLFTVSAGNATATEGGGCVNVRAPGTAKNALTLGATDNYTLTWANSTSAPRAEVCDWNWTPPEADARNIPSFSAQGRSDSVVKPDLVAPGLRITGPVSRQASRCPNAGLGIFCNENLEVDGGITYGVSAGTSFAAPAAAGAAAVVRRWYANLFGGNPSPALTKAMLINGARDLGANAALGIQAAHVLVPHPTQPDALALGDAIGNIPNRYQGWGMLNLSRLLGPAGNYFFLDQGGGLVPGGPLFQKYLYVVDGSKATRFTSVWTDLASTEGSSYQVVNDLNLLVCGGSPQRCWQGNHLSGGQSLPRPPAPIYRDSVNNVEQVIFPPNTLATGASVIVTVDPWNVMSGGQDFAFFADNAKDPPTSFYTVTPCRVVDTRNPNGPLGGPALVANSTRAFAIAGQCGISATAKSVAFNITVTGAIAQGSLRLWPGGLSTPVAMTNSYSAGQTRANMAILGLGNGQLAVRPEQPSGTVHVIIDATGYFE
jgi:subtilase family protein